MAGRFITLEGGEGVGKSTQLGALAAALAQCGVDVVTTREPGGSPGAEAIRRLLLEGETERWTPEAEALLFAAARADHVARTIRPALDRGKWVICDRFLDSSIAYQGAAGGVGIESVRALHRVGSHGFLPDRSLLLELPEEVAAGRMGSRSGPDRMEAKGAGYHRAVVAAFVALADEDPARYRRIDAGGGPEAVTARLLAALEDLL